MSWDRRVPLRNVALKSGPGPSRRTELARRSPLHPAGADPARKYAATRKTPAKPKPCTMCREPAQWGSRYCAPCLVVRELVLERDSYACVCCGTCIIDRHYSLGHRLRASQGGRAVASNLVTLLGLGGELHHGRIDLYRDPADATKGYRLKSGQDPAQVPVLLVRPDGSRASRYLHDDGTVRDLPQSEAA